MVIKKPPKHSHMLQSDLKAVQIDHRSPNQVMIHKVMLICKEVRKALMI